MPAPDPTISHLRCLNCGQTGLEESPGFPNEVMCPSCHVSHSVASVGNWQWVFNDDATVEMAKVQHDDEIELP